MRAAPGGGLLELLLGVPLLGSFLKYEPDDALSDALGLPSVRARGPEYLSALAQLDTDFQSVDEVLKEVRNALAAKAVKEQVADRYVDVARQRIEKVADALAHPETADVNSHDFLKTLWWVDEMIASLARARVGWQTAPAVAASTSEGGMSVGIAQGELPQADATVGGGFASASKATATERLFGQWGEVTPCDSGGGNSPPEAWDDYSEFGTMHDTTLYQPALGVKWNDSDAETPTEDLTVAVVSGPAHAAYFDLQPDGSFTYEPQPLWAGADQFTYELSDGEYTDEALAEVYVYNYPPEASDDSAWELGYSTDAVTKLVVDPDHGLFQNDSEPDGDDYWISEHTDPAHGTLPLLDVYTGAFEYMPDGTFVGEDTFTYRLTDGALDHSTSQTTISNIATVTILVVPKLDLDIAAPTQGVMSEGEEDSIGGLVVKNADNNNAPRKEIILQQVIPASWTGDVVLTKQTCHGDVRVFTAMTGGDEIPFDAVFPSSSLPKHLYVEGLLESDTMRDCTLTLDTLDGWGREDSVKFTVLWVNPVDVAFSGNGSTDNDKRDAYKSWTVANTYALGGPQLYNSTYGERMGWGTEARGLVQPPDFSYSGVNLRLDRDVEYHDWYGNGDATIDQRSFSPSIPPGNDGTNDVLRDNNPTDSEPPGQIFDLDAPGLEVPTAPMYEVRRTRNNFKEFASVTIDAQRIRASLVYQYYVRFSMQQMTGPCGNTWVVISPPDVPGDLQAGPGTTNLSWNLQ